MNRKIRITESEVVNQRTSVLWHLQEYGSISSWKAIQEYGATRLGAIICNLRKEGYPITTIYVTSKNRFGKTTRFAEYTYIRPNKH
tara:strand:+ start:1121 stop:1378 length:258 start_codon:yes stop_codon:yes gene_type:complete